VNNLISEISGGDLLLRWEHQGPVIPISFKIERGDGSTFQQIGEVAGEDRNFLDQDVDAGDFVYRVTAISAAEESCGVELNVRVITSSDSELKDLPHVFPNPNIDGILRFYLPSDWSGSEARILSLSGQMIAIKDTKVGWNQVELYEVTNGLYILQLARGLDRYSIKFIIQRVQ
jgi:hypothetical protein